MCKTDECQSVTAYKDIQDRLHTTPEACQRANKQIKESKLRSSVENVFFQFVKDSDRYMSYERPSYHWYIHELGKNWEAIRTGLNEIYDRNN